LSAKNQYLSALEQQSRFAIKRNTYFKNKKIVVCREKRIYIIYGRPHMSYSRIEYFYAIRLNFDALFPRGRQGNGPCIHHMTTNFI